MYSSMGTCIYVSRPGEEGALLGSISDIYFYKFTYHGASWQRFASWRADLVIWEISPVGGSEVDQLAPMRFASWRDVFVTGGTKGSGGLPGGTPPGACPEQWVWGPLSGGLRGWVVRQLADSLGHWRDLASWWRVRQLVGCLRHLGNLASWRIVLVVWEDGLRGGLPGLCPTRRAYGCRGKGAGR